LNSEEAALRLGNIRNIVGYNDLGICHLVRKLEFGQRFGLKLLMEFGRLDVESVLTIRILRRRKLADRTDLYETVKKVEDTCAIRDVFDSLATYVSISDGPRLLVKKRLRRRWRRLRSGGKICCSCVSRCSQRQVRCNIRRRVQEVACCYFEVGP
jgi:hypothetical protein